MATLEAEPQYAERQTLRKTTERLLQDPLEHAEAHILNGNSVTVILDECEQMILQSPGVEEVDYVSNQLADVLSSHLISAESRERAIDLWRRLLHPVDELGNRRGDDAAYIAQEVYELSRVSMGSFVQEQLDELRWDEFRESGMPDPVWLIESDRIYREEASIELRRRADMRRQLDAQHIAKMLDKMRTPYDLAA